MRFSTEAKALKAALRTVRDVTRGRHTMPILASVRIEVSGSGVTITATDLETALTLTLGETCTSDNGSVCVPIKALESALKTLKGRVILEAEGETVKVGSESYSVSIASQPADEYPTLPPMLTDLRTTSAAPCARPNAVFQDLGKLRAAIGAVTHAVSKDETRYNLNGMAIDADGYATPRVIATDGHRLAVADTGAISLPWEGIRIVPLKATTLLAKLLKGAFDLARVGCSQSEIAFYGEGFALVIKCIEGEYPDWVQVVPKATDETVRVDRDALLEGLERVVVAASERNHAVKLILNGALELEASNPDTGEAKASVAFTHQRGGENIKTLCFNANYLRDAAKALEKGELHIALAGGKASGEIPAYACSPIKLHGSDVFPFCIVMPMRV